MLYKYTEMLRSTVSQEIREVLSAEMDAPEHSYREVQFIIPLQPQVFITLDEDAAREFGLNRTYKMPPNAPGAQVTLRLMPGQKAWAAAKEGVSHMSITVEHHLGDPS